MYVFALEPKLYLVYEDFCLAIDYYTFCEFTMFLLSDYDYELPDELISQVPNDKRDESRLLRLSKKDGDLDHYKFSDLIDLLLPSDVLVVNNTRVIPGRLFGRKETGGKVEILILDYLEGLRNIEKQGAFECECLVKASKRPKKDSWITIHEDFKAYVVDFNEGFFRLKFHCKGDFNKALESSGHMPLPPYIKRDHEVDQFNDRASYQTVYASESGAIAAPTAGLHFTEDLFKKLTSKGVTIVYITLHVGYGTFLPVRVNDIREHKMHSEYFNISETASSTLNRAKEKGNRIIAVGTTSVRTLEYVAGKNGKITPGYGNCDLFIYPGYKFKMIDGMITNFHLPESTLLMLVSAFAGYENIMNAYKEAVENKYRFFSYGDGMLIE